MLSDFTLFTFAGTGAVPTLTLSNSPTVMGTTLVSPAEPTAVSNKLIFNYASIEFSGSVPGLPTTDPINESLVEREGSSFVPIATRPPDFTSSTIPAPVPKETISVCID